MGSGTVNERTAVGSDIFACNPTPEQKTARVYVEHCHVLVQALTASAGKRDAGSAAKRAAGVPGFEIPALRCGAIGGGRESSRAIPPVTECGPPTHTVR